ncbi:Asparaginyl-tRNA synthetase (mitochondrial) [Phaffia rhodozyma]|uniref:asparagine--tRNA ligase n=1 Tax=Phaffia rhodozyma TaxID=264483 RepID=A0A0F7SRR4_PHARH|nr:Asparaginyl-tRNA synthetase (mitochondrial) [Phaffia rhodozyma]
MIPTFSRLKPLPFLPRTIKQLLQTSFPPAVQPTRPTGDQPSSVLSTSPSPILASASTPLSAQSDTTTVHGWVSNIQVKKHVAFLKIRDGTSDEALQVVVSGKKDDLSSGGDLRRTVESLTRGSSVKIQGELIPSPGAGQPVELQAKILTVLGECDSQTYLIEPSVVPSSTKDRSRPVKTTNRPTVHLRELAHLRMRERENAAVVRVRDRVAREWRSFLEVGGGEIFRVTAPSLNETVRTDKPPEAFFPEPPGASLTVSAQLHLETYLPVCPRAYTLSTSFRAEPSRSSRHLAEFTMLEVELAFVNRVDELMDFTEQGVKSVLRGLSRGLSLGDGQTEEMAKKIEKEEDPDAGAGIGVFWAKPGTTEKIRSAIEKPFGRLSYTEAIELLKRAHAEIPFELEPVDGQTLQTEHEQWLASREGGPVFVYDYPASFKAFYMLPNEDNKAGTVACFDLLVPGVGELAGGSLREHRLDPLLDVMRQRNMSTEPLEWYLDQRRYGSVPHGGFGLGFDRMVSWVTGVSNLKDIVGFPRFKGGCVC